MLIVLMVLCWEILSIILVMSWLFGLREMVWCPLVAVFGTSSCGSLKSTLLQCPIYDAPTVVGSAQRQLPCPLDVRFGEPFVAGNAFSDKVDSIDTWHGSVSRVDLGLRSFPDCPSQCETTIANLGPFSDDREMQTLQNQRSEWMVHRFAPCKRWRSLC